MANIDETTKKVLLGLAIFFAGLIGIVVTAGLLRGTLDPLGVSTLLGGIFTGIVSGVVLRGKSEEKKEEPKKEEEDA